MPETWTRFFLVRVPLLVVAVVAFGEGAAIALREVPLRRSFMDNLALAVERDHEPHRVVLLGDSITLLSTRRFQLGRSPQDVANLATIAWTGAAAELFLLERYLANHPAPQHVVYAAANDDLDNDDSPRLIHYYDWNVYSRPAERAFLRAYVPGIDSRERLPALLNLQENILERLQSLADRSPAVLPQGRRPPDPNVITEPASENRMSQRIQGERIRRRLEVGALQEAVFRRICQLSQHYGFTVDIVWPPLPEPVRNAWLGQGQTARLDARIRSILDQGCNAGPIVDVNATRSYEAFNRDGFHLHGAGWEERYAADLSAFIAALPDWITAADAAPSRPAPSGP